MKSPRGTLARSGPPTPFLGVSGWGAAEGSRASFLSGVGTPLGQVSRRPTLLGNGPQRALPCPSRLMAGQTCSSSWTHRILF